MSDDSAASAATTAATTATLTTTDRRGSVVELPFWLLWLYIGLVVGVVILSLVVL